MRKDHVERFIRQIDPEKVFEDAKREFREYYGGMIQDLQAAEKAFRNLISLLLRNQDFAEPKVSSRIKDRDSCIQKFDLKYRTDAEKSDQPYEIRRFITDLIGVRIVCLYESDVERTPTSSEIISMKAILLQIKQSN